MKRRVLALIAATALVASSSMPAFAAEKRSSPENITITPTPKSSSDTKPGKSPKTGEVDYVLYGGLGAAAFASVAVFCKKKKEEA